MLTLSALVLAVALFGAEARFPYIIGGKESYKGRWPHQVSLQMKQDGNFQHACGASILNGRWILTAAHCVMFSSDPSQYRVRLGMSQLSKEDYEQELGLEQIIEHPGWDMQTPGLPYDMALIKTTGPIDLANHYISTIPMATPLETYAGNEDCWISGWGRNDRNSMEPSDKLLEAHIPVLTTETCRRLYGWFGQIHPLGPTHVCMGEPAKEDIHACHGDSGGPLVCKRNGVYELVGVASRTGAYDCSKRPSVYMRVSAFLDWINPIIAN